MKLSGVVIAVLNMDNFLCEVTSPWQVCLAEHLTRKAVEASCDPFNSVSDGAITILLPLLGLNPGLRR